MLDNIDSFNRVFDLSSDWVIVDDQSGNEEFEELRLYFGDKVISTTHAKSENNSINQLRAIRTGLSYLNIKSDEYYWVIDADDVPLSFPQNEIQGDIALYNYVEDGKFKTVLKKHSLWYTGAITSGIVVKGSILLKYVQFIFKESFSTVWYDIRLSMLASLKVVETVNMPAVLFDHVIHGLNDSIHYQNSMKVYSRLFFAIIKRLSLCKF